MEDPRECLECDQLCCSTCLNKWQQNNNSCPNCRVPISLARHVNRFVMQQLNPTLFNCEHCPNVVFSYDQRHEHWQKCQTRLVCRLEGCKQAGKEFDFKESLRLHWLNECNVIEVKCSVCQTEMKRSQTAKHRCEPVLCQHIKHLASVVRDLTEENKRLRQDLARRPLPVHVLQR